MVLFGITPAELLVLGVVGAAVLGPKDMPKIARQVGYLTGCAARYLTSARNRFAEFARDTELTQLHQEMRSTLTTIQRIQEDLRRGVGLPNARLMMEPLEASQLGSVPRQHAASAARLDAPPDSKASQPLEVVAAAAAAEPPDAQRDAAQSTVRAVPLPALRLEHFQTADVSSAPASTDTADSVAVSLSNFDHAAYAEFQALFDVPAGRSAPYLLPPDKSRGRSLHPATISSSADASAAAELSAEVAANDAGISAELLQGEVARWVRDYLRSDAGRTELARALHHLDGSKAGR